MCVFRTVYRTAFRGTVYATSFGLGFALFARPWPDSPIWAKQRDVVPPKQSLRHNEEYRFLHMKNYPTFKDNDYFIQCANDKDFTVMDVDKIVPEAHRFNQVSRGLLNLNEPIIMTNRKSGKLVMFGKADSDDIVGLDGKIHNGILLTLLDESLCFCGFDKLPNKRGVTANLKVDFAKKLQPNNAFILDAQVTEARGRKVTINGKIESLNGDPIATASCLLVEPKWFKYFSWIDLF